MHTNIATMMLISGEFCRKRKLPGKLQRSTRSKESSVENEQIVLLLSCMLCVSVSTTCSVVDSQFDWQTVLSFDVTVDFHSVVILS